MDSVEKDLQNRKDEIEKELELLFNANLKIVAWNVPEVDDDEAARLLWDILNQKLQKIKEEFVK